MFYCGISISPPCHRARSAGGGGKRIEEEEEEEQESGDVAKRLRDIGRSLTLF